MKWDYNPRTGRMEPQRQTGVEVTARQGGVMVEDHDTHIQFLINYGTSAISHCVGCTGRNIHLFNDNDARKIAERVRWIARGKGIDEMYFDWKTYSINYKNMRTNENHIYRINEFANFNQNEHNSQLKKEYCDEIAAELNDFMSEYHCEDFLYNVGFAQNTTNGEIEWIEIQFNEDDWNRLRHLSYFVDDAIEKIGKSWGLPYAFWTGDGRNEHTSLWLSNTEQ